MLFELTEEHAIAIINMLGSTPTNQGAWPLYEDMKTQFTKHKALIAAPPNQPKPPEIPDEL